MATIQRRSGVHSVAMDGVVLAIGDHEGVSVIELDWQATQAGAPALSRPKEVTQPYRN
jgi:hypothetical protein